MVAETEIEPTHFKRIGLTDCRRPTRSLAFVHISQAPYRELLEALHRNLPGTELVHAWLEEHRKEADWFHAFGEHSSDSILAVEVEDLWRLYALSRLSDTLLLDFQPRRVPDETWREGGDISLDDYRNFMLNMGLQDASTSRFHPFFHEIVTVVPSDDANEPITFLEQHWPTMMLGSMTFSRGGVTVRGGRNFIRKEIAEQSTLYWASRRLNRPTRDLGDGWGSNSAWRTSFRRDYHIGTMFYFNVDAQPEEIMYPDDALTTAERKELVLHRCLIASDKPHHDLCPWDDKLQLYAAMPV
jgi:hypothetical protein